MNKLFSKYGKNEKGITLIGLITTIIILLILAGIALSRLSGDNGLLEKVKLAKEESKNAQIKEENILDNYEEYISNGKENNAPVLIITALSKVYVKDTHADYMNITTDGLYSLLFNSNTDEGGIYKGILLNPYYPSSIEFTVTSKIKLYAYGHSYSDYAGSSGADAKIQKYNDLTREYENYKTVSTNSDGVKYELVQLEAGKYKILPAARYVNFDEWEYEIIE